MVIILPSIDSPLQLHMATARYAVHREDNFRWAVNITGILHNEKICTQLGNPKPGTILDDIHLNVG